MGTFQVFRAQTSRPKVHCCDSWRLPTTIKNILPFQRSNMSFCKQLKCPQRPVKIKSLLKQTSLPPFDSSTDHVLAFKFFMTFFKPASFPGSFISRKSLGTRLFLDRFVFSTPSYHYKRSCVLSPRPLPDIFSSSKPLRSWRIVSVSRLRPPGTSRNGGSVRGRTLHGT